MKSKFGPLSKPVLLILMLFATWHVAEAGTSIIGPDDKWTKIQKNEYMIGVYSGFMKFCGYFSEGIELEEIANLSPYGEEGVTNVSRYDGYGGNCVDLKENVDKYYLSRKDDWFRLLSSKYKLPAVTSPRPEKKTESYVGAPENKFDGEWRGTFVGEASCNDWKIPIEATIKDGEFSTVVKQGEYQNKMEGSVSNDGRLSFWDRFEFMGPIWGKNEEGPIKITGKFTNNEFQGEFNIVNIWESCYGTIHLTRLGSVDDQLIPSSNTAEERLKELKRLLQRGLITEDEAATRRMQILEGI